MAKKNKCLIFSSVITKLLLVLLIITAIAGHWIAGYYNETSVLSLGLDSIYIPVLITLYLALLAGFFALLALNKLLENIKKSIVFSGVNVQILKLISYFCFAESVIFFYFGFYRPLSFMVSAAAAFFGLLMWVLTNVFEKAVKIKEENDFTV